MQGYFLKVIEKQFRTKDHLSSRTFRKDYYRPCEDYNACSHLINLHHTTNTNTNLQFHSIDPCYITSHLCFKGTILTSYKKQPHLFPLWVGKSLKQYRK